MIYWLDFFIPLLLVSGFALWIYAVALIGRGERAQKGKERE